MSIKQSSNSKLNWAVNLILRLSALPTVVFVLYKVLPDYKFFTLHPVLMVIAYLICMLEAVLLFSSFPMVTLKKIPEKVTFHWILQTSCIILSTMGFTVAVYNKTLLGKSHFTSWHSWFGLAAFIFTISSSLGGIAAKNPTLTKGFVKPLVMKTMHASAACLTFSLVAISLFTGLSSNYFVNLAQNSSPVWKLIYVVPIVAATSVVMQVYQSYFLKKRSN